MKSGKSSKIKNKNAIFYRENDNTSSESDQKPHKTQLSSNSCEIAVNEQKAAETAKAKAEAEKGAQAVKAKENISFPK